MPNEENTEQRVLLEVEEPIVLDSTAQDIVAALQDLKDVVQPTNVYVDLDVSLLTSGWSSSAPYLYNWTSDRITSECAVKVSFLSGASTADQLYIEYEKVAGGVQFEAPTKPTQDIPVRIRIINAEASSVTAITDEMVSTSTTSGAANVKQALTTVNSNISTLNEQIGTVNGKIAKQSDFHYINDTSANFAGTWIHFGRVCVLTVAFNYTGSLSYDTHTNMNVPLPQSGAVINLRDDTAGNLDGKVYIAGTGVVSDWSNGTGNLISGHFYTGTVTFITQTSA